MAMQSEFGKPHLEQAAANVLRLAKRDPHVLAVAGDSHGPGKLAARRRRPRVEQGAIGSGPIAPWFRSGRN